MGRVIYDFSRRAACYKAEGGIMNDELGRQRQKRKGEIGNGVAKPLSYMNLASQMVNEPDHSGFFRKIVPLSLR
jgi:hypothetical protein